MKYFGCEIDLLDDHLTAVADINAALWLAYDLNALEVVGLAITLRGSQHILYIDSRIVTAPAMAIPSALLVTSVRISVL